MPATYPDSPPGSEINSHPLISVLLISQSEEKQASQAGPVGRGTEYMFSDILKLILFPAHI